MGGIIDPAFFMPSFPFYAFRSIIVISKTHLSQEADMVDFDILPIAVHVLNILLYGAFIFLCVWLYRYFSKRLKKSRSSN